jgi:glycosyltransferase involved in cell wall biosynthesis
MMTRPLASAAGRKPVLGYLVSHPIQYQAPLFRRLARSERIDFVALFGCRFGLDGSADPQFGQVVDFGVDLLGGYRSVFLRQFRKQPDIDSFFGLACPSIWASHPHLEGVILHGWRTLMMWQAALGGLCRRVPYFIRADTARFATARPAPSDGLRRQVRNHAVAALVRGCRYALSIGRANDRFYRSVGCAERKIMRVPYFVDNASIAAAAEEGRRMRSSLRAEFGIPDRAIVVLAVAKLIPRKRPIDLIRILPQVSRDVHLLWVGSGKLDGQVLEAARQRGVASRVHLAGFQPARKVWTLMGASDLFAISSESEPWGLVVNEAVAAGLPVLATDECGAAEDLIDPGRTGEILRVGDIAAWTAAVASWTRRARSGDTGDQLKMAELAATHSIERAAEAIEDAFLEGSRGAP